MTPRARADESLPVADVTSPASAWGVGDLGPRYAARVDLLPDAALPAATRLFDTDAARAEASRLLEWARVFLADDVSAHAELRGWDAVDGAVDPLLAAIRAGHAPAVALEVLAGLTALVCPKDHAMVPFWGAAAALAQPIDDGASVTAECLATADRVAPIGAAGVSFHDVVAARPALWAGRGRGAAWEALCMALDAVAGGSFAGLEGLARLCDAHAGSPAIAWLAEAAARVAREPQRATTAARRLDDALASGDFGVNAGQVVVCVRLGRKHLTERGTAAHDAWLRLASAERVLAPLPALPSALLPSARQADVRRAARRGDAVAKLVQSIERLFAEAAAAAHARAETHGPFDGLVDLPPDLRGVIEALAHYTVLGFREAYGLELLRAGVPRLAAWVQRAPVTWSGA